jgi:hypothetical protein
MEHYKIHDMHGMARAFTQLLFESGLGSLEVRHEPAKCLCSGARRG